MPHMTTYNHSFFIFILHISQISFPHLEPLCFSIFCFSKDDVNVQSFLETDRAAEPHEASEKHTISICSEDTKHIEMMSCLKTQKPHWENS